MSPTRVAYLAGHYVTPSHTFIVREVRALRGLGVEVETFSIWPSAPHQLLSEGDRAEAAATFSILPLRPGETIRSQLAALRASPRAYAGLVTRALGLAPAGLRGRLLAASWTVEALILWRQMRRRGITHVHAHLNGTGPAVALLRTEFANHVDGSRGAHSWSLTVHGPTEFYEVTGEALPEKVRSASFAVCISDFGRSQLMAFVDEEHWSKLHVVHCGVDPNSHAPRAAGGPGGARALRLLAVGRLTRIKGQALLLEALAMLHERGVAAQLTVVGDGPKRAGLERLAQSLGVAAHVHFTGAVGQEAIARHYDASDVFVHASFAEGIPVVLMEAMAHRLPVVAASVMGTSELVQDGENGLLVRPGRPDELAAAVERLAADRELRRRLGEAGCRTVESGFSVAASAVQLRDLLARYAG
jgi:glycosyltransferase involved in cell wall biosynthesis